MSLPKHKMLNSPIRWVGGKSRLRKHIIPLIPQHTCYVEPFAGAGWVLFGKTRSRVEVLNDIDQELVNFFDVLKMQLEELIKSFEWEIVSRAKFELLADQDVENLSKVERAHRFYYILMAGWGGELNYPRFQTSVSDGGHGNRLIGALRHLENRMRPVHDRLQTVIIENLPWEKCIDRYDRKNTFMYIDPPYPQNGCNYKHNMQDWEDHRRLANRLFTTECKWILSSYDIPEVREMYEGLSIRTIQSFSGMKKKKNGSDRVVNQEVVIANYDFESSEILDSEYQPTIAQQQLLQLRQSRAQDYTPTAPTSTPPPDSSD